MELNEYQMETAIYSHVGSNLHYPTLEAGELAKIDNDGVTSDKELSRDVLWYAFELGLPLEEVCKKKLASRKRRGLLKGKGDHR
jgi:hypothetical protein